MATTYIATKIRRIERLTEVIQSCKRKIAAYESERAQLRKEIEDAFTEATGAAQPVSISELETQLDNQLHLLEQSPKKSPVASREHAIPKSLIEAAEHVARLQGPVDAKRLADSLGTTFDGARLRLARATKHGLLRRVKTGEYEAVTPPEPGIEREEQDIDF